jgi:hypothetical protein
MSEVDKQIDRAMLEVTALSRIAKAEDDLPTMYLANQAWHRLCEARKDRAKRALALTQEHQP